METTFEKERFAKEFMNFAMQNPDFINTLREMMRMYVEKK